MICTVLGRRGCGKTTYIKSILQNESRLLILDTLGEFESESVVTNSIEFIDALESKIGGYFQIVFRPYNVDPNKAFEVIAKSAWIVGDLTMVIDEIDILASPISVPFELSRNLRYGRHRGLSLIAASRRAAEIPRLLTSQSDSIVSFNQTEPRDIQYLTSCCGSLFAEMTTKLQKFEYLLFDPFEPGIAPKVLTTSPIPG